MEPDEPPAQRQSLESGRIAGLVNAVKGLTITNAIVIIFLALALAPLYLAYRTVNDPTLLDRFLSEYREVSSQQSGCTIRLAREHGGAEQWAISTGFAYQGSDRWIVSAVLNREPVPDEIYSYCATLNLIVDYMRDPARQSPTFPGSDEPVVRQYERETRP